MAEMGLAKLSVHNSEDGLRREIGSAGKLPKVWFQLSPVGGASSPPLAPCDFALLAMLPAAMHAGEPIDANFEVDSRLLDNLDHFQRVWHAWRPDVFRHIVPIAAAHETHIVPCQDAPQRAAAVFSSGVDSTATLLRHTHFGVGRATRALKTAVMAHGFDMPLDAQTGFDRLRERASQTTNALGVDLITIKTNWRDTVHDWEMTFGVGLASLLHLLCANHSIGLIATEESYLNSFILWGSSFWNDRFFTSSRMHIESDAGELDRFERAALIADFPSIISNLHVCWIGPRVGENCGVCAKCVLTKLVLLVANVPEPWPFQVPLEPSQIENMELMTAHAMRRLHILKERLPLAGHADVAAVVAARIAKEERRERFPGLRRIFGRGRAR